MSEVSALRRREEDLDRIRHALARAADAVARLTAGGVVVERKENRDPVTIVDLEVDRILREILPQTGEGWLSEETVDSPERLGASRCWIVDPLDGTKEFVRKIPEWCISVGLAEDGRAVAGGILNPATRDLILGSLETGVTLNGDPVRVTARSELAGATVLASRSELARGDWDLLKTAPIEIQATGSIAWKLALVACGRADATWSLAPKHEWDVAGGVALVEAAGGAVRSIERTELVFNQPKPWLPGLVASSPSLLDVTWELFDQR